MNRFLNQIICGDCLEVMKELPDKSVDLVVADPPYNISKAEWDKWKRKEDYISWMGEVLKECERLLKDNGSLYFFHNDFLQMVELQNWINQNTKFVFKQMIVWNKRFEGASNKGFLDGFIEVGGLRNYQQMAEYILFYTFQDETGSTTIKLDTNNFPTLRQYFKDFQEALGLTKKEIIRQIGQCADHCFRWGSSQWDLPTSDTYQKLCKLPLKQEFIRREYEDLRKEYETLRYTFNNQKTHHSVWDYEVAKKQGHITPKPTPLIENIIHHSSNEGDIILDPFLGSGTTAVAALNTGRFFIGIEKEPKYVEIARQRVEDVLEHIPEKNVAGREKKRNVSRLAGIVEKQLELID
jgi:site-specific DNA-methyltransferase (adenine-specific)